MNKSTFCEIKYINGLFFKGQVYDCGRLQNTGSHTVQKLPPTHQMKILHYPHSNAILYLRLKLERCKPHNAVRHPTKYDVINDVKLFPTVYHRIYCRKLLMLSNQKSRYKNQRIRITVYYITNYQ